MLKMQRLEVSCAVRVIYTSLGAKGLSYLRRADHPSRGFITKVCPSVMVKPPTMRKPAGGCCAMETGSLKILQ